jgi:hypothetical protein
MKFYFIFFQVWRDPHVAIVDDSYASAPPGFKCLKGKNKKINFLFYLFYLF